MIDNCNARGKDRKNHETYKDSHTQDNTWPDDESCQVDTVAVIRAIEGLKRLQDCQSIALVDLLIKGPGQGGTQFALSCGSGYIVTTDQLQELFERYKDKLKNRISR